MVGISNAVRRRSENGQRTVIENYLYLLSKGFEFITIIYLFNFLNYQDIITIIIIQLLPYYFIYLNHKILVFD